MLFFLLLLGFYCTINAQTLGGRCRTPTGESAKCISVYTCDSIIALLRVPSKTSEQTKFLNLSRCATSSSGIPYVCCGTGLSTTQTVDSNNLDSNFTPNRAIPGNDECGYQSYNKIFNGETTALDEFPWMAVIEYRKSNGQKQIACGGSLINPRYVLTAAHCITGLVLTKIGQPINVRLGEYDTSSPNRDCFTRNGVEYCNQEEINAKIEQLIPHPKYSESTRYHDIGLIRLNRNIPYSDYIQPICLPEPTHNSRTGHLSIVAGWGKTEKGTNSNIKLKLQVPITDQNSCSRIFGRYDLNITNRQVCAGGLDGKDSCKGDSGGPLMRTLPSDDSRWMLEGVVSFGYTYCGTEGIPGVYTKVSKYVAWIHNTVEP
ncbi:hypothetical protein ABEB36_005837 [Hypothenemus hampei]|uniref:CLIP domain-containing serine protease n=1 Tax=Hypothenemus hampei TaxID=57062 RepID=A0ABD1EZK7_HYPHA